MKKATPQQPQQSAPTALASQELFNLPKTPLMHRGLECINVLTCKRCGKEKFVLKSVRRKVFQCMWCGEEYIYEPKQEEGGKDIDKFLQELEKKLEARNVKLK